MGHHESIVTVGMRGHVFMPMTEGPKIISNNIKMTMARSNGANGWQIMLF